MLKFIELFAGIGGFRYGLESVNGKKNGRSQAYKKGTPEAGEGLESEKGKGISTESRRTDEHSNYQSNGGAFTCIYSNEFNEHANAIYRRNYGQKEGEQDTRDITKVRAGEIPDHDLLTAGFPCQSFSISGQRGGLEDTRGTLFFEVARVLREKRPKHFILENVKGLLSHEEGRTFDTIIGVLTDLGYRCEWELVNSKYFGLPQSRDRVYIVGHRRGECIGRIFPLRRTASVNHKQVKHGRIVKAIHNKYGGFKEKAVRVFDILPTLRTPKGGGHIPDILELEDHMIIIRKTTPLETERGQGFPDNWTEYGDYGDGVLVPMSPTQRYRGTGNAVSPPVIKVMGEKLLEVCNV